MLLPRGASASVEGRSGKLWGGDIVYSERELPGAGESQTGHDPILPSHGEYEVEGECQCDPLRLARRQPGGRAWLSCVCIPATCRPWSSSTETESC